MDGERSIGGRVQLGRNHKYRKVEGGGEGRWRGEGRAFFQSGGKAPPAGKGKHPGIKC